MDRASILERLDRAELHVAQGAIRIERQRKLHAELERDGHAKTAAEAATILDQFEIVQAEFVADRDRFKEELAAEDRSYDDP